MGNKIYDVYFKLNSYSVFCVSAKNKKEAKEKAIGELMNMSKTEILERLLATLDVDPNFKITHCEFIENEGE